MIIAWIHACVLSTAVAVVPGSGPPDDEDEPRVPQASIDRAIDEGLDALRRMQTAEGAWRHGARPRYGATALGLYTLRKCGVALDDPAVRLALTNLAFAEPGATYDASLGAMALGACDAFEHRDWIAELGELLETYQNRDGDFGYPGGADLSNTQYAALGLRACELADVRVPYEVWASLADAVLEYGGAGGFSYRRNAGAPTVSMTSAGVGTLVICETYLARSGQASGGLMDDLADGREEGLSWLARRFAPESTLSGDGWPYYALYGVERVGALAGVSRLGEKDWYTLGARELVRARLPDGGWGQGSQPEASQTCFALLFLRRATSLPASGVHARTTKGAWRTDGKEDADVRLAATGGDPLTVWIDGYGDAALARSVWPGQRGRGPHVARVEWLVNGRVVDEVPGDATVPVDAERFPIRHRFPSAGTWRVSARVHVVLPPSGDARGVPGTPATLLSPELEIPLESIEPAWRRLQHDDRAANLLAGVRVSARASSSLGAQDSPFAAEHAPELAVDRRARSAWLARPGDTDPSLKLSFSPAVAADVLLLSHPRAVPHESGAFGRSIEVEVLVNDEEAFVVRMPPDERRKGRLEFDLPRIVRRLELRPRLAAPGSLCPATGLAEVELQRR